MNRVLSSLLATLVMVANMVAAPVPSTPKSGAAAASGSKTLPKVSKTKMSGGTQAPRKAPYQIGMASWYGKQFHGRTTANGEAFDMFELTAAHRRLPLGTYVKVTNLRNGKWIVVRINDRGPYVAGRIMDLSYGAARMLGFYSGIERVRLDLVKPETVALARNY
jgi:rare lipoprotein A